MPKGIEIGAGVMLDTPCSEVVWRVLPTHCILQFPLHLPLRGWPCAITFQLESTWIRMHATLNTNPKTGRSCLINYSLLRISSIRSDKELFKPLYLWGESRGYHDSKQSRTEEFCWGGSTNSVEDRGQRERGSGGGSPLVRGSGGSCNWVQEISFRIVIFP